MDVLIYAICLVAGLLFAIVGAVARPRDGTRCDPILGALRFVTANGENRT